MNITWVISKNEIPSFMYQAIVDALAENPSLSIFLCVDNKTPNIGLSKTLRFASKFDRRFRKYKVNPLELIPLSTLSHPRLSIVSSRKELPPCDFVILPSMDSYTKKLYVALASKGILCFDFNPGRTANAVLDNDPDFPILFWYRKKADEKWAMMSNMTINCEKGVVNSLEKYLWFQKNSLLKFLKNTTDYSEIYDVGKDDYSSGKLFRYYGRLGYLILKRKAYNKKYRWKLAIKNGSSHSMILQPEKAFWADPFIIKSDSSFYIFFEELNCDTSLGEIACIKVNKDFAIEEKKTIFKDDTHFSFPNVFSFDGKYYMIPENSEKKLLNLYEAVVFPYEWKLCRTMMTNIQLLDPVWTYHNGLYWIFANKVESHESDNNDLLCLYYSDDLLNGEWTAHKKNPIVTDSKKSRNAGAIYSENGKLYRPSQDCSKFYGSKIGINEILTLSLEDYSEKCVSTMMPLPGYKGIHTFNSDQEISVLDLLQ